MIYDMTTLLLNELFHLFVWRGQWFYSRDNILCLRSEMRAAPCDVEMARADHCPDHTWPLGTVGPRGGKPGPYIRCHVAAERSLWRLFGSLPVKMLSKEFEEGLQKKKHKIGEIFLLNKSIKPLIRRD